MMPVLCFGQNLNDDSSGYKGYIQTGYCIGATTYGFGRTKLDIVNGYKFNSETSIGIGIGLRWYDLHKYAYFPIYFNLNHTFLDFSWKNSSPFFSVSIGATPNAVNEYLSPGFYANPSFGISIKSKKKASFNIGLGYEYQRDQFMLVSGYDVYLIDVNNGAISIDLSYLF